MEDNKLNYDKIRKLYEKSQGIWPKQNNWYDYTRKKISQFIKKCSLGGYILNAGSGGNSYGLHNKMCHVDIVKKNICRYEDYVVANIEDMPFEDSTFDSVICVGDVINYCDAEKAIKELCRVVKKWGKLIIEFENSNSYEYILKGFYGCDKTIVNLEYMKEVTNQYLYSQQYLSGMLRKNGFDVKEELSIHIISSLVSNWISDDNISSLFAAFDIIFNKFSCFKTHGSNILYLCEKIEM